MVRRDTSGIMRRVGRNFKERLQELGGLDAVFDFAVSCHSVMEVTEEQLEGLFQSLEVNLGSRGISTKWRCIRKPVKWQMMQLVVFGQLHLFVENRRLWIFTKRNARSQ
ncbi:wings apart-like protein 2 isoform X1 [Magnolia sinica]|uniref:wings apart-like protein 2 isoform X1 n=1 Tax=Magnolia sinica TaxID=86752 RepID=UPI00265B3C77|nr:wings apart-like protein 2 isoform X1 [Magnolia sinica]